MYLLTFAYVWLSSLCLVCFPAKTESTLTHVEQVTLYIAAVGDGLLAADLPDRTRERMEAILTKIPKEQLTTVELVAGSGQVPLKLRVFVAKSEDARAVSDYIKDHPLQVRVCAIKY